MKQRNFTILMYISTPIIFLFGSLLMYLLIRDHPWFWYMIGGYFALLIVLYTVKLTLFRKFANVQNTEAAKSDADVTGSDDVVPPR